MPTPTSAPPSPTATAARPPDPPPRGWTLRVLGGFELRDPEGATVRLASRRVAALLARLALAPGRSHGREDLVERLWPGVPLDIGRNRLRQALSSLKSALDAEGSVLAADRLSVAVAPDRVACDALAFEQAVREGRHEAAVTLYRGELLPGFYDEWILDERGRLAALHERAEAAVASPAPSPAAPAARVAAPVTAQLPHYLTRFFAGAQDARLRDEVLRHRLVTLLGPGGAGKTRLAVELAHALQGPGAGRTAFDLIGFVPLVGAANEADVLDALHAALQVAPAAGGEPLDALVHALGGQRTLLVLDNFEQLVEPAAGLLGRLLALAPGLHALVTSRRALGLDGEREFTLQPLPLPEPGLELADVVDSPALALFIDRARAVSADFHPHPRNLAALVALTRALQGMPLALELAASRVRALAPADMLALLGGETAAAGAQPQLELLRRPGPRAGLDPRHASMQRVIEWSWSLLPADAARLLGELTVMRGGFTLAAARAVGSVSDVAGAVETLLAHSLLHAVPAETPAAGATLAPAEQAPRFDMYEAIREFAAGRIAEGDQAAARRRLRGWLIAWGRGFGPTVPLAELRAETGNVLAALAGAVAEPAPAEAVGLMLALRRGLGDVALPAGASALLLQALEDDTLGSGDTALLLRSQGHSLLSLLYQAQGAGDAARHHAGIGLELARRHPAPPPGLLASALHVAASRRWRSLRVDDDALRSLLDEAMALATGCGDRGVQASVCALRAAIANAARDHARAEALHTQALQLWESLGDEVAANSGRYNLAVCANFAGRRAEALQRLQSVMAHARAAHDWKLVAQAWNQRGEVYSAERKWPEAATAYRESARLARQLHLANALAFALWNLPHAVAHLRDPERAARLAGFGVAFWQTRIGPIGPADEADLRLYERLIDAQIGAERRRALWAEGTALGLADGLALALEPPAGAARKVSAWP